MSIDPIDPVTTCHLLQDNPENAAHYASSLIKSTKPEDLKENYWFPTPEDPGDPQHHALIQKQILSELRNLQDLGKRNPQDNPESRQQFVSYFDWTGSMLQQDGNTRIEDLQVEFHDIFARHRFDICMNDEFKVKLTPKDDSLAYSQNLPTPINVEEDIHVELALLHRYGIITALQVHKPKNCQKKPNAKLRHSVDVRKIKNLTTTSTTIIQLVP